MAGQERHTECSRPWMSDPTVARDQATREEWSSRWEEEEEGREKVYSSFLSHTLVVSFNLPTTFTLFGFGKLNGDVFG